MEWGLRIETRWIQGSTIRMVWWSPEGAKESGMVRLEQTTELSYFFTTYMISYFLSEPPVLLLMYFLLNEFIYFMETYFKRKLYNRN